MQKIQDALDLVEMEGGSSPMGHAFLKAVSSSFQKRMTSPLPRARGYSSVLYSVFKKAKEACVQLIPSHGVQPAPVDGQLVPLRLSPHD